MKGPGEGKKIDSLIGTLQRLSTKLAIHVLLLNLNQIQDTLSFLPCSE